MSRCRNDIDDINDWVQTYYLNIYQANYLSTLKIIICFSQEQLEMIADRLIKEADQDGHGYMKFEEFEKAINDIDVEGKMAFVSFYQKKI